MKITLTSLSRHLPRSTSGMKVVEVLVSLVLLLVVLLLAAVAGSASPLKTTMAIAIGVSVTMC